MKSRGFQRQIFLDTESCPSWPKEHDWKSCSASTSTRGFESLALRQERRYESTVFYFFAQGIRTRNGSERRAKRDKERQRNSPGDCFNISPKEQSDSEKIPCSPSKKTVRKYRFYFFKDNVFACCTCWFDMIYFKWIVCSFRTVRRNILDCSMPELMELPTTAFPSWLRKNLENECSTGC